MKLLICNFEIAHRSEKTNLINASLKWLNYKNENISANYLLFTLQRKLTKIKSLNNFIFIVIKELYCIQVINDVKKMFIHSISMNRYSAEHVESRLQDEIYWTWVINNVEKMFVHSVSERKYSIDNKIYLYEMLTTNLLQAMLVRRAEQSHWQSSNSAICACYAHIHRSSIALQCSQTTRLRDQMIMWSNSERKFTSKWSAFTIHRSSIASWCSQTTQSLSSLLNYMIKQWTKAHVEVTNFHNTLLARLARSAK